MANNFLEVIEKSISTIQSPEHMLAKGLNIPNNATNSGGRKIMNSSHQTQSLVLSRGEPAFIHTGYESRFGEMSSSIIKTETDYEVIARVNKFSYAPNHHYYTIVRDINTNEIDYIERISYKFKTEVYGYLHNNTQLDNLSIPGNIIPSGTVLRRSTAFDGYGNRASGTNINVAYMALDDNMEDSVVISESCSNKLSCPLIKEVKIIVNENDIPLNIYGNDQVYKIHPDIGEEIKDGFLMVYRREKREESVYTQSVQRLQEIMMSDEKITEKGIIIDIDIRCNNPEYISTSTYNQQFYAYYQDRIRMCQDIINVVGPYKTQGYKLSYKLSKLYDRAKSEINGVKFIDKKQFSNIEIVFTIMEDRPLHIGDKVVDRYGGKGVVSKILPDSLMPRMKNGRIVDMIKNSSTMYNRENCGQTFEVEINYISMCILDRCRDPANNITPDEALSDILKFVKIQSPLQYQKMKEFTDRMDMSNLIFFLESILSKTCIPISNKPISDTMDIDKLAALYKAFPWVNQQSILVPIKGSNGSYRFIDTRRPVIVAPQYCLRLKQYAEEKFSVTSLSPTNLVGHNAKSKAYKNHREPNSNTPIKFGQMETGDLDHMGTEFVVINLLLHSISPRGRRLVEEIAIGDPYNVDVKLDKTSKNRSAEILNTRLKTMGHRLRFKKTPKQFKKGCFINGLEFFQGTSENLIPGVEFHDKDYDFEEYYKLIHEIDEISDKMGIKIEALSFYEQDLPSEDDIE